MIPILFLYALSASSLTIGRAILDHAQPFFFLATRMLCVGGFLLAFSYLKKQSIRSIHKDDRLAFFLMAVVHVFFAFGLELIALQSMQSNQVALLYNLSPFITAVCSYFYFSETITAKKIVGLVIGFCALLPDFFAHFQSDCAAGVAVSWAHLAMIGAVVATVYGWVTMRGLLNRGYAPSFINGVGMLGGGFLSLLTSLTCESWSPVPVSNWSHFFYLTFMIALFNDVLFYNLYGRLLKRYTATFLSFAGFLLPFITAIFGMFFLGEFVTYRFIFSAIFVAIGLGIFYYEELKDGYAS